MAKTYLRRWCGCVPCRPDCWQQNMAPILCTVRNSSTEGVMCVRCLFSFVLSIKQTSEPKPRNRRRLRSLHFWSRDALCNIGGLGLKHPLLTLTSLPHLLVHTRRLMMCKRVENPEWGTVDYVDTESQNGNVIFKTVPEVRENRQYSNRNCAWVCFCLFFPRLTCRPATPHLDPLAGT